MQELFSTAIGRLRLIGAIEAISFLLLVGIAMPLKYLMGQPKMVSVVGAAHGGLWVLYLLALLLAWRQYRWSFLTLLAGGVASMIPFGPFIFDAKVARSATSS